LNNFIQQHKLGFKGKKISFGEPFSATEDGVNHVTYCTVNINRKWKSDQQWFTEYGTILLLNVNFG
jgi:hypothetical protein